MAKLTPKHLERLSKAVDAMPVELGTIGFLGTPEQLEFERSLLDAKPWKDLLTSFDLYFCVGRRARRFETQLPKDYSGPMAGLPDALRAAIKEDIRQFLQSLPRRYFIYFALESFPKCGLPELQLCKGVALVDTTGVKADWVQGGNSLQSVVEALSVTGREKLKKDAAYIRLDVTGYADSREDAIAFQRALGKLKHLLLVALFNGAVEVSWAAAASLRPPFMFDMTEQPYAYVHDADPASDEKFRVPLPDALARYLRKLTIDEAKLEVAGSHGLLSTKPAESREERNRAIRVRLNFASTFAEIPDDDADTQRLRAAIEWYFDAEVTENQTISFLQRCIGIEALLGDDKPGDVVSRLSERFSYLLGETPSERERLAKKFKRTYEQRSGIVHGRNARLPPGDGEQALADARDMLANLIWKEATTVVQLVRKRASRA